MGKRLVTVRGTGEASLAPDTIQINLTLEARAEVYEEAIQLAATQLEELRLCLAKEGFTKSDLITTQFSVNTDYENVKNEAGEFIRVFKGYIVRNQLTLAFPINNERLGRVLRTLSQCESHPEFSIQYLLKDDQELQALVLKDAVNNAKQNAQTLARASGITLGEIVSIQYDWSNIQFKNREFVLTEAVNYSVAQIDLQPDNITASANVTIVWEIKQKEQENE